MINGALVLGLAGLSVTIGALVFLRDVQKRRADITHRRDSLWFDNAAQLYRWESRAGTQHASPVHPERPGGDWFEAEREGIERLGG